ncbi:FMN-binding protein [Breznakiella homolactica]|uniref:FMN-binding protein n=1 Tax=Breznakiella homolactica TaxID=2798577 RepID=A0A7T7XQY4_9SPIR|nr:FMN-binding protein [Breznakiella homolactica]QQO10875.1 FMN-binding protein [Breznakiella homolactica]
MKTTGKKKLSKGAKIILSIIGVVVVGALAFGINYYITFLNYEKDVAAIQVQDVDLNTIADGEYFGDCNVDLVRARVRVVVENHVITELELVEHYNDRGAAADALPARILEEQRVNVDAVSGATASSNVIREAVYNALTGERTIRKD